MLPSAAQEITIKLACKSAGTFQIEKVLSPFIRKLVDLHESLLGKVRIRLFKSHRLSSFRTKCSSNPLRYYRRFMNVSLRWSNTTIIKYFVRDSVCINYFSINSTPRDDRPVTAFTLIGGNADASEPVAFPNTGWHVAVFYDHNQFRADETQQDSIVARRVAATSEIKICCHHARCADRWRDEHRNKTAIAATIGYFERNIAITTADHCRVR